MNKKFEYRVSRRDFLKLAAVATASAVIPSALLMNPVLQSVFRSRFQRQASGWWYLCDHAIGQRQFGDCLCKQWGAESIICQPVTLVTTIYNPSGEVVTSNTMAASNIDANAISTFTQNFTVSNPQLWSPTAPHRYQVQVEVKVGGVTVGKPSVK
jgi:hypothetical protein